MISEILNLFGSTLGDRLAGIILVGALIYVVMHAKGGNSSGGGSKSNSGGGGSTAS